VNHPRTRRTVTLALLALLLVAGGALRFADLNWDQFQHVHPDERFIVWVADTMSFPADLSTALDPVRSPLNPFRWPAAGQELAGERRNYAYGHFPLYLLLLVAHAGVALADWLANTTLAFPAAFQPLHTVGRHLADYNVSRPRRSRYLRAGRPGHAAPGVLAGEACAVPHIPGAETSA
jgi:hypothetical protein